MAVKALVFLSLVSTALAYERELDLNNDKEWLLSKLLNPEKSASFKIYLFNFTNPEEFLDGAKPKLDELGPYVYGEKYINDEMNWLSENEIEYIPKRLYKFKPRQSNGKLMDEINAMNVPMFVALHQIKNGPSFVSRSFQRILERLKQTAFEKTTIRKIIWGQKNPLIRLGREIIRDPRFKYPYENYGMLVGKNMTDNGKARINTGLGEEGYLGEILKWNDEDGLKFWKEGSQCDRPVGTEGIFFKPNMKNTDTVQLFNRNFCRSIKFVYQKDVVQEGTGIKGKRFVPSPDTFESGFKFPDNKCFCLRGSCRGVPSGVFNMSECQYGAPIMLSFPHFLYGNPDLIDKVEGISPDPEKHLSYFDISPAGTLLKARAGAMLSIAVDKVEGVKQADKLRKIIIPIMYFMIETDGITDPDDVERVKRIIEGLNS